MESIRVGVFADPPWINDKWENGTKPGILIEIINYFCRMMKRKCHLMEAPDKGYGDFTNGSWHGMVKHVSENMFDVSFPGLTPTKQRFQAVDFSDRVYKVPLVLVTRAAEPGALSLWSFMAFHWSVWLLLLSASAFLGFFLAFIEMAKWDPKRFFAKSFIRCLDSFAIMSNQGSDDIEMVRTSVRLLITFWAMATLILGGVYSGHLLSSMIGPSPGLPFKDFDTFSTCVEENQCQLVTHTMSISYLQEIFTSPDATFVKLNNSLTFNPILVVPHLNEMMDLILQTRNTYLTWYTSHAQYMAWTKSNKKCEYANVDSGFTDDMAFALQKNSHLKEYLNMNVTFMNSLGIPLKIYNDYIGKTGECGVKQIEGSKPLPFTSIIGLLFILACGSIFGLGGLIFENILHRCRCRIIRKKSCYKTKR